MTMCGPELSVSRDVGWPEVADSEPVPRLDIAECCETHNADRTGQQAGGRDLIEIPRRVLLVEPTPSERWWLRNELIAGQMEVFEASDVISALRAIPIFQPSVILAQLRLPTYSGMDLVRRLKQDHSTQPIPILLYTDIATAEERIRAFDLGAGDFVSKPFVGAELLARVRAALRTMHLLSMLERRARLDGLTGLANRGVLEDRLPREWEACRRRGVPLAVVICDLDHFKSINDTHGHGAGDEVLRQAAASLARTARASDLVARYGGEEFVVVAPDCDLASAVRLAERSRAAISGLNIVEHGVAIPVSTSVGVAACSQPSRTSTAELLKRADEALYRAKESGRDATWYWDQDRNHPAPVDSLLSR
jgi:diguanylate cyclase (GGDEF)-like protein